MNLQRDIRWWASLLGSLRRIIRVYDLVNRVMSLGFDVKVRKSFLKLVSRYARLEKVLDIGCGPGTLAAVLLDSRMPRYIVCLDPIPEMLVAARERLGGLLIDYVVGVGEALPFRSESFDTALAAFSLRDFIDWRLGLDEMSRVSRCIGILDIAKCRGLRLLAQVVWWGLLVPLLAFIVARANPVHYLRLARSILQWVEPERIAQAASRVCKRVELVRLTLGFSFALLACKA